MERTRLDYAQPTHPAEAAARHIPDYARSRNPFPVWRILVLLLAGYFAIGYLASRFVRPVPPPAAVGPTSTAAAPTATRQP